MDGLKSNFRPCSGFYSAPSKIATMAKTVARPMREPCRNNSEKYRHAIFIASEYQDSGRANKVILRGL